MTEVGFAGLGRMGAPMARRVLEAGFPLTVWNRTPARAEELVGAGAGVAASPRTLAEGAEIVVTMVADSEALDDLLHGDEGLLAGLARGSILVDMSTIGPKAARTFAGEVAERGAHWIDAPVSGSTALAAQGALTLMIGGENEAIERAEPVLAAMAQKLFRLGGPAMGAAMKLVVNSAVAVLNEAIAEALVLAERAGIEREAAYDVLGGGAVAAPYVLYKRDAFLRPDETPTAFTVDLMRKDLQLVLELASELGVPLPAVRAADATLTRAGELGLGDADFAGVVRVLREA